MMTINTDNLKPNFKIDIPVRISDINYGNHLGHAELIKITHHARLKFFSEYSLKENDLSGSGVIVKNLFVEYKGESFFDDILHIYIYVENINKISCGFRYEITKNDNKLVATVIETILFMNYQTRRLTRVPQEIHELKNKHLNEVMLHDH